MTCELLPLWPQVERKRCETGIKIEAADAQFVAVRLQKRKQVAQELI